MPRIAAVDGQRFNKRDARETAISGESLYRAGDKGLTGADHRPIWFLQGQKKRISLTQDLGAYPLGGKPLTGKAAGFP